MKKNCHRIEFSILLAALLFCGLHGLASGQAGAISGRVTDMSNNGLLNVNVYVQSPSGAFITSGMSDASGNYTITPIADGSYKVRFGITGYIYEYYNDKHSFATADIVTVSGGGTTSNINAQLAPVPVDPFEPNDDMAHAVTLAAGTYNNLVIDSSSEAADWFKVYVEEGKDLKVSTTNALSLYADRNDIDFGLYSSSGQLLAQTISDKGNETLWLADVAAGWYYMGIPSGEATYSLTIATGDLNVGAITSQVTNSLGSAVQNAFIWVYPADDPSWTGICEVAPTDASGNTKISVPPGDYRLNFDVSGNVVYGYPEPSDIYVVGEWYNKKTSFSQSDVVTVQAGQTTPLAITKLADGAAVTGHVQDNTYSPIYRARAYCYSASGMYVGLGAVYTDASGNYTIKHISLADGPQRVQLRASGYAGKWYNDKTSFGTADPISLQARQTTTGINAQLAPEGKITGRVTDVSNNGLSDVYVYAYDTVQTVVPITYTTTTTDGYYTIYQLPTANVRVYFRTDNAAPYLSEYYNDKSTFDTADSVSVASGQTTPNINAQLALKPITVTSPNGGETWLGGSSHNITWTTTGSISNVKIEYSTDYGVTYNSISASAPNTGSYRWTLPNTPFPCLVKVSDASNAGVFDVSDTYFSIITASWGPRHAVGDFDGDGADEVAVDFGTAGVWMYNAGTWSQLTSANSESLAAADVDGDGADELLADLGSSGLWLWNAGSWGQLSGVNVEGMATGDVDADGVDEVVADFGTVGLWLYNGGVWTQLSGVNADYVTTANINGVGGDEIIGDFGGIGLWVWSGGIWTELSGVDADYVTAGKMAGTKYLVGDFGATGLWLWTNGGGWTQLSGVNADYMITADTDADANDEIVGDFGAVGLWLWDSGTWTILSGVNADFMIRADVDGNGTDEIVADFGTLGLWIWNTGVWTQLSGVNPEYMLAGDFDGDNKDEIMGDFGSLGLWLWNEGSWSQISANNPD